VILKKMGILKIIKEKKLMIVAIAAFERFSISRNSEFVGHVRFV